MHIHIHVLQEIRQLCSYLVDLKRASAEEMRRSVYANYTAFIRCVYSLLFHIFLQIILWSWKLEKRHQYCFKIYFSNPDTKSQLYVNYMIELIRQTVQSRMLEILLYNENHTTTSQALEHFPTVASSRLSFILIEFSVHALFLSALHFLSKKIVWLFVFL